MIHNLVVNPTDGLRLYDDEVISIQVVAMVKFMHGLSRQVGFVSLRSPTPIRRSPTFMIETGNYDDFAAIVKAN